MPGLEFIPDPSPSLPSSFGQASDGGMETVNQIVAVRADLAVGIGDDRCGAVEQVGKVAILPAAIGPCRVRSFFPGLVEREDQDRWLAGLVERAAIGDEASAAGYRKGVERRRDPAVGVGNMGAAVVELDVDEPGRSAVSLFEKAEGDAATLACSCGDGERPVGDVDRLVRDIVEPGKADGEGIGPAHDGEIGNIGHGKRSLLGSGGALDVDEVGKARANGVCGRVKVGEIVARQDRCP